MLKQVMLNKRKKDLTVAIEEADAALREVEQRESELVGAIEEAATEEEKSAVEDGIAEFEKDQAATKEKKASLEKELAEVDAELKSYADMGREERSKEEKMDKTIETTLPGEVRAGFFVGMNARDAAAIAASAEVKEFAEQIRAMARMEASETRAIGGAELTIPTVLWGLVRDNLHRYSKLIGIVNRHVVRGKGRIHVMGAIPEAVWTEQCGKLNPVSFTVNQMELDGFKVGGYIAVCNSILEDSDYDLVSIVLDTLSQSVGLALDKAILYGTGVKMPLGVVTRLAQASKPASWPSVAPAWADLRTTNILKLNDGAATPKAVVGAALFKAIVLGSGAAKADYSRGERFWAMNDNTYLQLMGELLSINATGAVATGMSEVMPIIGGAIIKLPFIPDGDIIGGFGDLYNLADRKEITLDTNDRLQWIEENTLFKAVARYDGSPLFGQGFVLLNINNVAPTTTVAFAPDTANA